MARKSRPIEAKEAGPAKAEYHVEAKPDVGEPFVRANLNRQHEVAPNYFSVYANDVQVQSTPWDMRLILGLIMKLPTEATDTVTVSQIGEIRLSQPLAKRLTMIMIQQLQNYEKTFGEIPLPQG